MPKFNPDLLLGDELEYEALLRGIPHKNNVANLRKSLRDHLNDPTDLKHLKSLDIVTEIQLCSQKLIEVQEIVSSIGSNESPMACLLYTSRCV